MTMIFKNYHRLFNHIIEVNADVNLEPDMKCWQFIFHTPHQVAYLYIDKEREGTIDPDIEKAYGYQVGLLEIYTEDDNPQYIAVTSDVNIYTLKAKWCQDYCRYHNLDFTVTEDFEERANAFITDVLMFGERI
jgi:hypothetical protein